MNTNNIRGNKMSREWINPRLHYLGSIIKPSQRYCPECDHELTTTDAETYCTHCGLITSATIQYVAGQKIDLPYGIQL